MNDSVCGKWFTNLCTGDFSVNDAKQLNRKDEIDSNKSGHLRIFNIVL